MPNLRLFYILHSIRSDWNNGNAHFLRGLLRAMTAQGHMVTILEPATEWSIQNLLTEPLGQRSLDDFNRLYPELDVQTFTPSDTRDQWNERLGSADIVILHEWNPPALAQLLLSVRTTLGFKLLFHDTHHRASSSPSQIHLFGLDQFDGILAFGRALERIYRESFNIQRVWTLHEAADTTLFYPIPSPTKQTDCVWIGNWGEGERTNEISQFLLTPASHLPHKSFRIYGVRYPEEGLEALEQAGVEYCGYLPNLDAPATYANSKLTVHIPRQQYTAAMSGIPTIRVFEALACGIPLISAPWQDTEQLFRPGDFLTAENSSQMTDSMALLMSSQSAREDLAGRGLETIRARHTCKHRSAELTQICEEVLQ